MKPQFLKNKIQYKIISKKGFELKTFTVVAKIQQKNKNSIKLDGFEKDAIYGMTVSGKIGNAVVRNILKIFSVFINSIRRVHHSHY